MTRTAVLNVVGLTPRLIGAATPQISRYAAKHSVARVKPAFPGVTCTAQSNYVTGQPPSVHGIVANGWYDRTLAEVQFWKQSNHVVGARKLWDELKQIDPAFTCAKMFWWYNMYSSADYSVTPRPAYPADGRKVFDVYSWPYSMRPELKARLGDFPFPTFWGPAAGRKTPQGEPDAASRWIAGSAKWVEEKYQPTLNLVYLPHLDYNLQRFGNSSALIDDDLRRIDAIVGDLITFFEGRGVKVVLLSEYGITDVNRPIHLNRLFREKGWITIKEELGLELLDAGNSRAFAVADHQVAHIYVNDASILNEVRSVVEKQSGVAQVLGAEEKRKAGMDHARAGDLVAVSDENAWFTYYYWRDDAVAPDFARCVDIHRKPGYDPVELFLDPALSAVKLRIAAKLLKKKLGFRMLMDVVPLDASLVKGSHAACPKNDADWPVLIGAISAGSSAPIDSTEVYSALRGVVLS